VGRVAHPAIVGVRRHTNGSDDIPGLHCTTTLCVLAASVVPVRRAMGFDPTTLLRA
jgi:hypothetical protein